MTIFNPVQAVRVNLSHEVPCRFLPPDYADGIEVPRLSLTGESLSKYFIYIYKNSPGSQKSHYHSKFQTEALKNTSEN
jgi:hypothetical protein